MIFPQHGTRPGRVHIRVRQCVSSRQFSPLFALCAAASLAGAPTALHAQRLAADSAKARADSTQPLERVIINAIRGSGSAPISATTINRSTITNRNFGQDVPLLLQGAAPSLTAYSESGVNWGYSYMRLRGIDQSRINITMDGVPLNDSEDQVLYFADFPDLSASIQSVQVQRGVGTSSAGTASFAGSVNFETTALATRERAGEMHLQVGSFGARRVMGSYSTGLTQSRFAANARLSAQQTNGYRYHSGVYGYSGFLAAGYFGDRDIVKLTATAGLMRDTLSYLAERAEDLKIDRRKNSLAANELDSFGEQLVSLGYTRLISGGTSVSATTYRLSASGNYDVAYEGDLYNYGLDFQTYGVTSALHHERGRLKLDGGLNASTYWREHVSAIRPRLDDQLYNNTGHKLDASAFAKLAFEQGRTTWFSDVQVRRARFAYDPSANAGIDSRNISWVFLNPKVGVTVKGNDRVRAYTSFGITSREPTRSDMFAGADNMDSTNVASIGDLTRVKPERVYNTEAGVTLTTATLQLSANVYSMEFRNEIAKIGALSLTGSPLRRNVGQTYRRGLEVDATWRATDKLSFGGNATFSMNRIKAYTDSSGSAPATFTNVQPLLTPAVLTSQRGEWTVSRNVALTFEGRYQSKSYLTNTGNEALMLPDYFVLDGSVRFSIGGQALVIRAANLGDTKKFSSGYDNGDGPAYFILPPRSVFVTAQIKY
ncbi:MAG: TonB-dependent receptor [Phycisphaerae bacterium]|nr:TonB-dependent receptor [Gemmatimonadaceae bacterium]